MSATVIESIVSKVVNKSVGFNLSLRGRVDGGIVVWHILQWYSGY